MATITKATSPTTCQCAACRGLECLERPRYFAGQLLTEAELNDEQAYVIAKNRLHNRYLHGWGVVCGLEVVCHNCDGWVRVKSGYALDPCGNDVVVCRDRDLNVLAEIQKCRDAKKRRAGDCDEWRDQHECDDEEEHWCIALEYRENEARGVMPLQEKSSGAHSGCGCGGEKTPAASPSRPSACESTRILEQYRLTVVPEPPSCALQRGQSGPRLAGFPRPGSFLAAIIPARFHNHPLLQMLVTAAPSQSLLARAIQAADTVEAFFTARFGEQDRTRLMEIARTCLRTPQPAISGWMYMNLNVSPTPDDLCCRFRRAVRELYEQNPLNVRCQPFDCPPCAKPAAFPILPEGTTGFDAGSVTREGATFPAGGPSTTNNDFDPVFCCLVDAVVNYLTDAVCSLLIPPCPPEPCDERVILACVTVSKERVVRICNHSCRRYAGSFPALEHWTSAVPFAAIVRQIVREVCCADKTAPAIREVMAQYRGWSRPGTPIVDPIAPDNLPPRPDTTPLA